MRIDWQNICSRYRSFCSRKSLRKWPGRFLGLAVSSWIWSECPFCSNPPSFVAKYSKIGTKCKNKSKLIKISRKSVPNEILGWLELRNRRILVELTSEHFHLWFSNHFWYLNFLGMGNRKWLWSRIVINIILHAPYCPIGYTPAPIHQIRSNSFFNLRHISESWNRPSDGSGSLWFLGNLCRPNSSSFDEILRAGLLVQKSCFRVNIASNESEKAAHPRSDCWLIKIIFEKKYPNFMYKDFPLTARPKKPEVRNRKKWPCIETTFCQLLSGNFVSNESFSVLQTNRYEWIFGVKYLVKGVKWNNNFDKCCSKFLF